MKDQIMRNGLLLPVLLGIAALSLLSVSNLLKADVVDAMEKALMPGPLTKAHADLEEKCTECHEFFKQGNQRDKCLACHDHENIAKDIKQKKGLHGRMPEASEGDCKVCHRDHVGRDVSIIFLDEQTFDHKFTDFTLRGAHREVLCRSCHKKDKQYHQANKKCYDCHKEVEPHKGKLGKVCQSCHRESAWNDFQFDHSRTKFKLVGKHKGVDCRDCHPQERYLSIPKKCYACHKLDDKHKGRFGKNCKDCHKPSGWAKQVFDHDIDTDFKLLGAHHKVACAQCHKDNAFEVDLKRDCYSCHRLSDEHKGSFGKKCQDCHTEKSWSKVKFDHAKTDFPLKGKHKKVICKDCHPGDVFKDKIKGDCYACHKQSDVHNGQQGKYCGDCHNEENWNNNVAFDHGLTKFPLLGTHGSLACEECHTSTNFRDADPQCGSCHVDDDFHKRRLGRQCDICHISSDWKAWQFDHDSQTDFKLKGSHTKINCHACHQEPVNKPGDIKLDSGCYDCHANDDAHDGGFGRLCERCHNEESFDKINIRR
ncbi:MAG: cytochrome C [Thiohalomonadales bacterium]